MRRLPLLAAAGLVLALAGPATAALVPVSNYSWLQLPEGLDSSVGSSALTQPPGVGTGHGDPIQFRWGGRVWIPNGTLTDNGTLDYWATLHMDQSRPVHQVRVQFYFEGALSLRSFVIEGSNDGVSYSPIGTHDYGDFVNTPGLMTLVNVTPGSYQHVRLRLPGGEYTNIAGNSARGGPGVYIIEPIGSGSLPSELVNWANTPNFGTVASTGGGANFGGTGWTNGTLYDRGFDRGGSTDWDTGQLLQVDLGQAREIARSIAVWESTWGAVSYNIMYSTDGQSFSYVTGLSDPIIHFNQVTATEYTFDPVNARYFRFVEAESGPGNDSSPHEILNQWMLYQAIPEPGSLALLAMGGLALLRRRR